MNTCPVPPSPTLSLNTAVDLYCLMWYELPTYTAGDLSPAILDAWCGQLIDDDGCVTLYQNCGVDCSTGTLEHQGRIPGIKHSLGGAPRLPDHAITWDERTVHMCVESSATLYSPQSQSCNQVVRNSAATDRASHRAALYSTLTEHLRSIDANRGPQTASLVTGSILVSIAGRELTAVDGGLVLVGAMFVLGKVPTG